MRLSGGGVGCAAVVVAAALVVGVWSGDVNADPTTDYVIVVSIDGLRCYEAFHSSPYPDYVKFMRDSLCTKGTLYRNMWNRGVTQTQGGHLTIGTGTWQLMPNGLTYFGPRDDTVSTQADVPTFFEYYNKANDYTPGSNKTFYVGGKCWRDTIACSVDPEFGRSVGGRVVIYPQDATEPADTATYRVLIDTLGTYHPHLVLVNLKDVDVYGHWADDPGHSVQEYYTAIQVADSLVWELWNWIQDDATYQGKTTLIVTTDHGRHDDEHGGLYDHAGVCHGCRHTFGIVAGPAADVKQCEVVSSHVDQIDICPTVGELLGFYYPKARGRPLVEALDFSPAYMVGTNYGAGNDNVRVSNTDSISVSPYIISSSTGDTLHVVYVDKCTGKFEVMYKRSTNSGADWGDLDTLSATEIDTECPSICAIGNTLYATWMDCNWHRDIVEDDTSDWVPRWYLYFCKSTNAGGSWGSPTQIVGSIYETDTPTPSQSIWDPVVNYDFDSVVGIAVRYGVVQGQNRVGCFRSTNGGSSWTASWLDDEAWFPLHCSLATEAYQGDNWAFGTWYDLDTLRTSVSGNCWYIMFNRSSDGGAYWGDPVELHKDSTYVADPSIDTDLPDVLVSWALWKTTNDKWQICCRRSTNTGEDWQSPDTLTDASYGTIDPELIFATDNNFYDFWVEYDISGDPVDSDIVYKYSTDGGQSWSGQSTLSVGQSYSLRPSVCRHKGTVWEDYRHGNWEIYFDLP